MILFNSIFPGGFPLKDLIAYPNKVKFAKLGDSLLYDTWEKSLYGDITITSIYGNNNFLATGGNITPNISVNLSWTKIGYSGNEYPQQDINTYTVSYSADLTEGFTLNTTTGEVICSANTTEESKLFTVLVTIIMNISGALKTIDFDFTLNAGKKEVVEEWVTEEIIINSIGTIPPNGKTVTLTTEAKQYKYYYTYINGVIDNNLTKKDSLPRYIKIAPTYTVTGTGFSIINNTQLHVDSRGEDISGDSRLGTITATYYENGKEFTALSTVTQSANTLINVVTGWEILEYTYPTVDYNEHKGSNGRVNPTFSLKLNVEKYTLAGVKAEGQSAVVLVTLDTISDDGSMSNILQYPNDFKFMLKDLTEGAGVWEGIGAVNWDENTSESNRVATIGLFVCTGVENGIRKLECIMDSTATQRGTLTYKINGASLNFTAAGGSLDIPRFTYTEYIKGTTRNTFDLTNYTLEPSTKNGFSVINNKQIKVGPNEGIKRTAKFTINVEPNTSNRLYYESGILTCTLDADRVTIEYGDIEITGTFKQTIPASGGTVTVSAIATQKITTTYASGKDTEVVINTLTPLYNKESEYTVTGGNLKDIEKSAQTLLSEPLYWRGEGDKNATIRLIVIQEKNEVESTKLRSIKVTKFSYKDNINYLSLALSSEPTIEVLGNYVKIFTSRYEAPYTEVINNYTREYSINNTNFTINKDNGIVLAKYENTTGKYRIATVEVKVTYGNKTCTETCNVLQSSGESDKLITLTILNPLNLGWIISDKELSYSTYDPTKVRYDVDTLEVSIPVYVYRVESNDSLTPIFSLKQYDGRDTITININAI